MTLSTGFQWEDSRFKAALGAKLEKLSREQVPAATNKTAFFVALKAMSETPKKTPFEIEASVGKTVTATNKRGDVRKLPILWILAARAVGKTWPEQRMERGLKNKRQTSAGKAYLRTLAKKAKTILGSRKRAGRFLRVGWLSVVKRLGPFVRNKSGMSYASTGARIVGQMKGNAIPATAGYAPTCTITHSAQALSDRQNGQFRLVVPALNRAMASEAKGIIDRLDEETRTTLNGAI